MKKIIAMGLCLLLAVSLAGCGTKETGNGSQVTEKTDISDNGKSIDEINEEEIRQTDPEEDEAYKEAGILKEPPALTVAYGDKKSIEALKGTYSWVYRNEDGTKTGITADSMHPLNTKEIMPQLYFIPTPLSHIDPLRAYLQWDTIPDRVSVHCWDEECRGQPNAESEELEVLTLTVDSNVETAPIAAVKLKDGNYVYEVVAEWNSTEEYGGTACYSFCTVKPNMTDGIILNDNITYEPQNTKEELCGLPLAPEGFSKP